LKLLPRSATLMLLFVLISGRQLRPNVFADAVNHLKQKHESVDNGIGKAVGLQLSGVLETATAPVLDDAAARFTQVAQNAAGQIDQTLKDENASIDQLAQSNIGRIDTLLQTRLDDTGKLIDERLSRVEKDADRILDREASIVDNALKEENTIVTQGLDRLQTISSTSLDRIQSIEGDAFNRIDSALQDQVPVAASQVAHEFVIAALVVACVLALFVLAAINLWKNLQSAKSEQVSTFDALKAGLATFWHTLPRQATAVLIPAVLVAGIILAAYETYLKSAQAMRITHLEKAASLLEAGGEYKLAADLRRRVVSIDENSGEAKQFAYQADLWLADFTETHATPLSDLLARLDALGKSNSDLQAASIYLKADSVAAAAYVKSVLQGKRPEQVPLLGKLALMTQIKSTLDQGGSPVARVEAALKQIEQLQKLYPKYANGYILKAELTGMLADNAIDNPSGPVAFQKLIGENLAQAEGLNPALVRIVRLNAISLPADLLKGLDTNPHGVGLTARLGEFATTQIAPLARAVVVSTGLTRVATERTLLRATRRSLGELKVTHTIAALPPSGEKRAAAMLSIAQQLFDIDSFLPAQSWVTQAAQVQHDAALDQRIDCLRKAIEQAKISTALPAAI
jgi:hypothetical protein